jgi:hypothetical protein
VLEGNRGMGDCGDPGLRGAMDIVIRSGIFGTYRDILQKPFIYCSRYPNCDHFLIITSVIECGSVLFTTN